MFLKTESMRNLLLICLFLTVFPVILSCSDNQKNAPEAVKAFNSGVRAIKADNLDMASHHFKRALILNPDLNEARLNLANVYFLNGRLDLARNEYSNLLSRNVDDPRVYFNLGWIYLAQDEYDTAYDCFTKCLGKTINFYDGHYGLALVAKARNEETLVKFHLEKYLEYEPDGHWAQKAKDMLSFIPADDTGASEIERIENEVEAQSPEDNPPDELTESVEQIPQQTADIKAPSQPADKEVKQPGNSAITPVAEEKKESNVPEKSEKKESIKPASAKSASEILKDGLNALKNGSYSEAETLLKDAYTRDKKSADAAQGLSRLYFKKGQLNLVDTYLKETLKRAGLKPDDNFQLGKACEKIGYTDGAIRNYTDYLKSNPFGEHADAAKKRLTELDQSEETNSV
jgi:Tfp pilus assembly protein PilF